MFDLYLALRLDWIELVYVKYSVMCGLNFRVIQNHLQLESKYTNIAQYSSSFHYYYYYYCYHIYFIISQRFIIIPKNFQYRMLSAYYYYYY